MAHWFTYSKTNCFQVSSSVDCVCISVSYLVYRQEYKFKLHSWVNHSDKKKNLKGFCLISFLSVNLSKCNKQVSMFKTDTVHMHCNFPVFSHLIWKNKFALGASNNHQLIHAFSEKKSDFYFVYPSTIENFTMISSNT